MKRDNRQQVKEMSDAELVKRLAQISKEIAEAKMQFMSGTLKNVHAMKAQRKELALIKTLQSQRKLTEETK